MDKADLTSKGWVETGGRFTAHPKTDPRTGEMQWFAYSSGEGPLNPFLDYGVSDAAGRVLRRDRFKAPYCSMVHDFIVSENYTAFPCCRLPATSRARSAGCPLSPGSRRRARSWV